jgi:hypothetical protein
MPGQLLLSCWGLQVCHRATAGRTPSHQTTTTTQMKCTFGIRNAVRFMVVRMEVLNRTRGDVKNRHRAS